MDHSPYHLLTTLHGTLSWKPMSTCLLHVTHSLRWITCLVARAYSSLLLASKHCDGPLALWRKVPHLPVLWTASNCSPVPQLLHHHRLLEGLPLAAASYQVTPFQLSWWCFVLLCFLLFELHSLQQHSIALMDCPICCSLTPASCHSAPFLVPQIAPTMNCTNAAWWRKWLNSCWFLL